MIEEKSVFDAMCIEQLQKRYAHRILPGVPRPQIYDAGQVRLSPSDVCEAWECSTG